MFIKTIYKTGRKHDQEYVYYRLCESYRIGNSTRHHTILNLGSLDEIETPHERKQLADCIERLMKGERILFKDDIPEPIHRLALRFYEQLKQKGQLTAYGKSEPIKDVPVEEGDIRSIDINSVQTEDTREAGSEWLCKQTIEELGIEEFLAGEGWDKEHIERAMIGIISKAVYPGSEHKTAQWINDNSAVAELFHKEAGKINRFQLYRASRMLYGIKDKMEDYLSKRTNGIFDIEDEIIIYDLTNTYFEGRKENSRKAKFGKSKEKRSDCKIIALALVTNGEGFVKYSKIYKGNIADCKTLGEIVTNLAIHTSFTGRKPRIVIDAGIATEDNLAMLREEEYEYLCVTRSRLKEYKIEGEKPVRILDNRDHVIEIQFVEKPGDNDRYLYVHSEQKAVKEASMNAHYSERYEEELRNLASGIHKKGGTKKYEKVLERIGRIKERYPAANKHYNIEVKAGDGVAREITWNRTETKPRSPEGTYFIRTNIEETGEQDVWKIYNTIREIEASFRILKTDLSLRPIYHQEDIYSEAHLFLGVLAYMVVNTIRYRLKSKGIHHDWQNIVRIMNTQKLVTVTMKDNQNQIINTRTCSLPTAKAHQVYTAMDYKSMPFYRKKFVLPHK
jgi:transposase